MLTEREQKIKAEAERRLAMPPSRFILLYGVLFWGIPVGILVGLIKMATDGIAFDAWLKRELWINLGTFALAGVLFGFMTRNMIKRQLKKLKEKEMNS